jgi:uncharacterized protein YrrD
MLHSVKALAGFTIAATDGDLGRVKEVYFDDAHWTIRYFVVDTGGWPGDYHVLLSSRAVSAADWSLRAVRVNLTRRQVRNCPGTDTDKPVSRQYEEEFNTYYGYPYYWAGAHRGPVVYPGMVASKPQDEAEALAARLQLLRRRQRADPHLRSSKEVIGYHLHAADREIGHAEDFLFDERDWSIQYMVVATRNWLPGKRVLISPDEIERVSWEDKLVFVNRTRDELKDRPEYDETRPPERGMDTP